MALKYTTVQRFWQYLGINLSTQDYVPENVSDGAVTTIRETVKASPVTATTYYLTKKAVNPDTLVAYVGSTSTQLTLTTDYTFDSDTSAITITSAGETALTGEALTVVYEYCEVETLSYNVTDRLLMKAEADVERRTRRVFADQTATNPGYNQINNEFLMGQGNTYVRYNARNYPLVKLQTTVDGAYTTGGASITLADATGFPNNGTIYIGGNKVTYTAKSTNTLTIPTSTPSIDDGAVVRGEVIEISNSGSGTTPSYIVLTPETDYAIDYDTGEIQLQQSYYFDDSVLNIDNLNQPARGVFNRVRLNYMTAWHENGEDCIIPEDIVEVVHMIAARSLAQRTVSRALVNQRDNFNPQSFGFSKVDIDDIIRDYKMLGISTTK